MREQLLWATVYDGNDREGVVVGLWVPWLLVLWLDQNEAELVSFERAGNGFVFTLPEDEVPDDGHETETVDLGDDTENA